MAGDLVNRDLSKWLIGGLVKSPALPQLEEHLTQTTALAHTIRLDPYGALFFTKPNYLDWAENEHRNLAKFGFARSGDDFVTASELLHSGLVTRREIDYGRIRGNALVFCCDKHQPQFCAYKTLLSVQQLFYTEIDDALIFANNLGVIARFVKNNQISPKAIPLHFIYRSAPGQITYFANISRLRPGEALYRDGTSTKIVLRNTLRTHVKGEHNTRRAGSDAVNELFNQLKNTMARYLKATSDTQPHWTMLLSGGIDSSALQMAINGQLEPQVRPVSHTFAPDVDGFAPEIDYAKAASRLFGTEHTFVSVPTADYPNWLTTTLHILGQPPHHESTAYRPPLFDYIAKNNATIKYLFSAQGADALHGLLIADSIARATRYQQWPLPLLYFLGAALRPISQPKSYGAWHAADVLRNLKNWDSPQHPLNAQAECVNGFWTPVVKV